MKNRLAAKDLKATMIANSLDTQATLKKTAGSGAKAAKELREGDEVDDPEFEAKRKLQLRLQEDAEISRAAAELKAGVSRARGRLFGWYVGKYVCYYHGGLLLTLYQYVDVLIFPHVPQLKRQRKREEGKRPWRIWLPWDKTPLERAAGGLCLALVGDGPLLCREHPRPPGVKARCSAVK